MDMKRVIFGAALLLAAGCSSSGNTASTAGPLRVSTIVVEPREDLHAGIYVGVVEEENAAALSFPVAGTVTRLCVEEGTRVRQGDLIAELDATSAREAFEAAKPPCSRPAMPAGVCNGSMMQRRCPKSSGSRR